MCWSIVFLTSFSIMCSHYLGCLDISLCSYMRFSRYSLLSYGSQKIRVENTRFELVTSCLQGRRSPNLANPPSGIRFHRHLLTAQCVTLARLEKTSPSAVTCLRLDSNFASGSFSSSSLAMGLSGPYLLRQMPTYMGLSGLEPPTSRLSGVRSNRLSYKPVYIRKASAFSFLLILAATCSPVPSPVKYHRPPRA